MIGVLTLTAYCVGLATPNQSEEMRLEIAQTMSFIVLAFSELVHVFNIRNNKESLFNYKYEYTYEVMIPYEVLGLTEKPKKLNVAFAVKTPNEKAYILNRRDGAGNMEAQDWLWIDRHYPQST